MHLSELVTWDGFSEFLLDIHHIFNSVLVITMLSVGFIKAYRVTECLVDHSTKPSFGRVGLSDLFKMLVHTFGYQSGKFR